MVPVKPEVSPEEKRLKRIEKMQWMLGIGMLLFLAVFTIGVMSVNRTLTNATKGIPQLVESAQESLEDTTEELQTVLDEVNKVDFEGISNKLGDAGDHINSIDIEALNTSIQNLEKVVAGLSKIFGGS